MLGGFVQGGRIGGEFVLEGREDLCWDGGLEGGKIHAERGDLECWKRICAGSGGFCWVEEDLCLETGDLGGGVKICAGKGESAD